MYYAVLILIICVLVWRINNIRAEVDYKKAMMYRDCMEAEFNRRRFQRLLEDHADVRAPLLAEIEKLKATIVEKDERIEAERERNTKLRSAFDNGEDWGPVPRPTPDPAWPFPRDWERMSMAELVAAYPRAVSEINIWKNANGNPSTAFLWENRLKSIRNHIANSHLRRGLPIPV